MVQPSVETRTHFESAYARLNSLMHDHGITQDNLRWYSATVRENEVGWLEGERPDGLDSSEAALFTTIGLFMLRKADSELGLLVGDLVFAICPCGHTFYGIDNSMAHLIGEDGECRHRMAIIQLILGIHASDAKAIRSHREVHPTSGQELLETLRQRGLIMRGGSEFGWQLSVTGLELVDHINQAAGLYSRSSLLV